MKEGTRETYRKEQDKWVRVNMSDIKKGDILKCNEPDGTPCIEIAEAVSDAKYCENAECWQVVIKDFVDNRTLEYKASDDALNARSQEPGGGGSDDAAG